MSVIDEYLIKIETTQKNELEKIRAVIHATVPEVEETIDYGMPAFKYKGKYLIGFYVYKNHMSLFPTSEPINSLKSKLGNFKLSKGTIQFSMDNTIPESIIRKLLLYRLDNIDRLSE